MIFFNLWIFIILCYGCNSVQSQVRLAPGVPPQQYHQPSSLPQHHNVPSIAPQHQQYYNNPQVQANPNPSNNAHMPQVQLPHIQDNNQIPQTVGHDHHEYNQPIFDTVNIAQEKEHIQEHLRASVDTSKMSEQELQFHYFKMHDSDNNNKLDGCELIKSLIHWHEEGSKEPHSNVNAKLFTDDELGNLIDPILKMDDTNNDGYIDYPEFIRAQQKAASNTSHQQI